MNLLDLLGFSTRRSNWTLLRDRDKASGKRILCKTIINRIPAYSRLMRCKKIRCLLLAIYWRSYRGLWSITRRYLIQRISISVLSSRSLWQILLRRSEPLVFLALLNYSRWGDQLRLHYPWLLTVCGILRHRPRILLFLLVIVSRRWILIVIVDRSGWKRLGYRWSWYTYKFI